MKRCGAGSIRRPERYRPPEIACAVAISCGESRSKTRRASGSSPAVTSSPVRQQMFSVPCSAAPTMSASSASRLRSRQTSCITGSIPSWLSAIATATGDACACAAVLSVALTASTYCSYGAKRSRTASRPPASTVRSSAVTTKRPARMPSSSPDIPPRRRLLVALGQVVAPGGGAPEPVVDRRAQVVDLLAPGQLARALDGVHPDAAHLRINLAVTVRSHPTARPVAQLLRALHRARESGRVQHALAAHVAAEDRLLDGRLDEGERAHHAVTAERLRWIRSLARRTAVEASAA